MHAEGAPRREQAEVTGGINLERVRVQGQTITTEPPGARYSVNGTVMRVIPVRPVAPGSAADLEIDWSFKVPSAGASGRMGHNSDNLFYIGYWYPQMAVYDDVNGWFTDPFLGRAEFYHGFADYNITIEAPAGWAVMATGEFLNPEEVLAPHVLERYRQAVNSDEVVCRAGPGRFRQGRYPSWR
jgi:hypothetical protein